MTFEDHRRSLLEWMHLSIVKREKTINTHVRRPAEPVARKMRYISVSSNLVGDNHPDRCTGQFHWSFDRVEWRLHGWPSEGVHTLFLQNHVHSDVTLMIIVGIYFDRSASFRTRDHSLDKLLSCLCQPIESHHYRRMRWYSGNRIVHHLRTHFEECPVNRNQSLFHHTIDDDINDAQQPSTYVYISMWQTSIGREKYIPRLLCPS